MYYLNGEILYEEPYDESIFYGKSIFETIAVINGKSLFLKEHLDRLFLSSKKLKINIQENLEGLVLSFISKYSSSNEEMLKILVSNNKIYMKLLPFKLRDFPNGTNAILIKNYFQNEMGMYKSANYLSNILAREEVVEGGYFEGVFTNRLGQICEGTISNIFFIKDNVLYTPSLELNILSGVTRKLIIDLAIASSLLVQEGFFYEKDLKEAEAIFFTNSLMKKGLVWLYDFEGKKLKKHEIIHKLENKYLKIQSDML